ncbi:MAG: hypothetical protein H6R10_2052 [Rhodocyclaceae bacterium]|nr:hypothetical protein [Rhodocyclaceae bacterium]
MRLSDNLPLSTADTAAADTPTPAPADPALRAKAEAAAEKFEGFFIGEMLRQMRRASREFAGEDSIYKDRAGADMLDMTDTLLADTLAGQRAFGIADLILRQLLPTLTAPAADAPADAAPFKSGPPAVALDK